MNGDLVGSLATLLASGGLIYWIVRWRWPARQRPSRSSSARFRPDCSPAITDEVCARVFPGQDPAPLKALFERFSFKFSPAGTFTFQPPPGAVAAIASRLHPPETLEGVLAALDRYGSRRDGPARGCVQLDILKLASGDSGKIPGFVEQAKRDFRDVISAAESPAVVAAASEDISIFMDPDSPRVSNLIDSDLQQYVEWLLLHVAQDMPAAAGESR